MSLELLSLPNIYKCFVKNKTQLGKVALSNQKSVVLIQRECRLSEMFEVTDDSLLITLFGTNRLGRKHSIRNSLSQEFMHLARITTRGKGLVDIKEECRKQTGFLHDDIVREKLRQANNLLNEREFLQELMDSAKAF